MFSTRRRENLFEDHTVNETSILAALIANTCIVEGFIVYIAVQLMWPAFAPSLQNSVFTHIAAFSGMAQAQCERFLREEVRPVLEAERENLGAAAEINI